MATVPTTKAPIALTIAIFFFMTFSFGNSQSANMTTQYWFPKNADIHRGYAVMMLNP